MQPKTTNHLQQQKKSRKILIGLATLWCGITTACQAPRVTKTTPQPSITSNSTSNSKVPVTRFDGTTITVVTRDRPQIAEPLQRRAPEFEKLTGAKIKIVTVPFGKLYEEINQDLSQGTKKYDVIVFPPQWMVDYATSGYLENLTQRVAADTAIDWNDIAPFFRDFSSTYQSKIVSIPLDGDFQMVYYRTDLLEKANLNPPETWEDYLAIAKQFHNRDLNNDSTPDYGSCTAKKSNAQSHWMFWSVVTSFLQSQGTQQGAFFDPDTMKPLVKNEAVAAALDIYSETVKYGPPDELNFDLEQARDTFIAGRCALTLDWGDTGTLAIAPNSKVKDKVGAVILPGTKKVLDRTTGKLIPCDKLTCPFAINGVNHAPYAAFGGWVGAINNAAPPKNKDAGYAFISYLSQPAQANIDVTIGVTGFNPYRTSQFTNREPWLKAGMSFEAASKYLGAIGVSLRSPNIVLDLRIPENNLYQGEVLDKSIADFLAGKITRGETIEKINNGWEEITNKMGREKQRAAYRASLGLYP
ncbi:extracellular solute-binding protein [Kamptonema sp. UHCC 0994]|uniref:ABC transporter substrate-binding protein n=1 Tax=Kamptonema sp. UHCC 0994 TaxID=3031329 RepID=UPI0023BA7272|nr:extracellular solute-binding protein [Kamptonema sp. UHCC 0994]MDF0556303.1 extracellular solute-binding protein [Kamptonema sp. UHCC 0994]